MDEGRGFRRIACTSSDDGSRSFHRCLILFFAVIAEATSFTALADSARTDSAVLRSLGLPVSEHAVTDSSERNCSESFGGKRRGSRYGKCAVASERCVAAIQSLSIQD